MLEELTTDITEEVRKALRLAYERGLREGEKRGAAYLKSIFDTHWGLTIESHVSKIPVGRKSLEEKLRSSSLTVRDLISQTKESAAKLLNLSIRETLELVDVLAHYGYVFEHTDFPF